ncbi:MAG TPA: histidine kinase [Usitatibacter sp.]|nr:histidine kinase [Usitatibacter sp.]
MTSFLFVLRITAAWAVAVFIAVLTYTELIDRGPDWVLVLIIFFTMAAVIVRAFSHVRRVRLVAGTPDKEALGNRHRRQVEMPMDADQAFALVDATIRELPYVLGVESVCDSLQVRARLKQMNPFLSGHKGPKQVVGLGGPRFNQVLATVTPGESTSSLTLICEPEGGAWVDWFLVDYGTNLQNAEAVTRALSRRISELRKGEQAAARETATEKELTVAKLSLLHAQVEPHFLYNTLASAQILTRTDPGRADQMLGNLIVYLRHSLPRSADEPSTLGEELERARANLEILAIRMGERLRVDIQVPASLHGVALPPMMLQTLVENAIKHGLEPVPGGGTVWILAREADGRVAITVADDGRGFSQDGGGTGIGLRNVRERLRLAYGDAARFDIVANFPRGVAATIVVPIKPGTDPEPGRSQNQGGSP